MLPSGRCSRNPWNRGHRQGSITSVRDLTTRMTSNRAMPDSDAMNMHPYPDSYIPTIHPLRAVSESASASSAGTPSQPFDLHDGQAAGDPHPERGVHSCPHIPHLHDCRGSRHRFDPQFGHLAGSSVRLLHTYPQRMHPQRNPVPTDVFSPSMQKDSPQRGHRP